MICTFCEGVFHPATGSAYGERVVACYRCTMDFWVWARLHTSAKAKRKLDRNGKPRLATALSFYEAAGMHVRK